MNYRELRIEFQQQVFPSQPNDWDIEDALLDLKDLDEDQQRILLQAVPTIWPISHSLSFSFLKESARNGRRFDQQSLAEWLRRILSNYEQGGLKKARAYMAESDITLLLVDDKSDSAILEENLNRLTSYSRGLTGLPLSIQQSPLIYTDTETIFLPAEIKIFPQREDNFLTYTVLIGLQTSFIRLGSFGRHQFSTSAPSDDSDLLPSSADQFFAQFEHRQLAKDLYQLLEISKAMNFLHLEYPGLVRDTANIRKDLYLLRKRDEEPGNPILEYLLKRVILPEQHVKKTLKELHKELYPGLEKELHEKNLQQLYTLATANTSPYQPFSFLPFMDRFDFVAAEILREARIEENRKKFATALADFLLNNEVAPTEDAESQKNTSDQADSARIQITRDVESNNLNIQNAAIIVDNEYLDLPDEIKQIISQIISDHGTLPDGFVSAAFGIAGKGRMKDEGESQSVLPIEEKFIPYDEWDYRRQGYRKNWCGLRERTLKGVRSAFVEKTLVKHRQVLMKVRRQFEMMRTQERFARRRRYGNDLDLDALIDSLGDQQAGLPPSEQIFIRLLRNERSITTYFLVDMSNSTEGWIGVAIKEALLILCEAMEVVGDSYAIYGFSGMRRMRSEVYRIKDIKEKYTPEIKQRLAAISPREYTRMGPPIRHMIQHFRHCDTRTKLLLILSDGKPEDYDDYKGRYAIEDTRKALAEARGHFIHPYCITIDRESHDYLEYMFGRGNYTFIKKIEQLPSRLTEIYRLLTR